MQILSTKLPKRNKSAINLRVLTHAFLIMQDWEEFRNSYNKAYKMHLKWIQTNQT